MAKQFLTSIDLSKNQLLNAVVQNLTAAPGSPVAGQIYFNTSDKNVYLWTGSVWADLTSGAIESIIGGSGLSALTVNGDATLDVNVDNVTLEIAFDAIRVKDVGITTGKIADSAITTVKINANAVTFSKLQTISPNTLIGNMTVATTTPSEVVVVTDLANATSTSLATSSSIKTYIDTTVGGIGNLEGAWDASTGAFPQAGTGTKKGDYWYATISGTAGGINFNVGDVIIAKVNGASISTSADWIQLEVNRDQATTTVLGLVTLATSTEVNTGTDTSKVVTPATLAGRTATESRTGLAEIATQAETDAGTDDSRFVTPLKLATYITNAGGIGSGAAYAQTLTGSATTYTVTHNLDSLDVVIEVYEVSTGETVFTDVVRTSVNAATISFGVAPTSGQYRVVVKK